MRHPSRQEREALLELLLALGGPLVWTGPIPYDALRARHESASAAAPKAAAPTADGAAQAEVAVPMQRVEDAPAAPQVPPVTGTCAA